MHEKQTQNQKEKRFLPKDSCKIRIRVVVYILYDISFIERVGRPVRSFLFVWRFLMAKGKGGTVQTVESLVAPVLESLGMRLWDVRFEKEGPDWFLRIYIDRDEPLDLEACETAARAINPVIDEADPIDQSYYLEVGSPGLGRRLTKDMHFEAVKGSRIAAHLFRANEAGERDVTGILKEKDGSRVVIVREDGTQTVVEEKQASYFKLCDDEDLF